MHVTSPLTQTQLVSNDHHEFPPDLTAQVFVVMVFTLISTQPWDPAAAVPVATQRLEVTIHQESTTPKTPRQTQRTQVCI